jgi:glycosyltransferase involved in cell wall biosynthesis
MIGVVIPAHNEGENLAACLAAVACAAAHPDLRGEAVYVVVVLDSCTDDSEDVARAHGVGILRVHARNVGLARATGASQLIAGGARWLAFTDADTVVARDWLAAQVGLGADAVCGVVSVDDWSTHTPALRERYEGLYQDRDDHRHIHGANFGVSTQAYLRAGGFSALAVSEDVAMVEALVSSGARIAWSALPRVATSARTDPRAAGGFGDYLRSLASPAWKPEAVG